MKPSKQHSKLPNYIYLGTIYLSPLKREISHCEKIKNLGDDIITFNGKGWNVILQGYFNERTSNCTDFVNPINLTLWT